MNIRFFSLATFAVAHDYYRGACLDFELVPTRVTATALRHGRVLQRVREGVHHFLYEGESVGSPLHNLSGTQLYFGLRLTNPHFENFTNPVLADAALTPLYANSVTPDAIAAPRGVVLTGPSYAHRPSLAARPLALHLRTSEGYLLDSRTLNVGDLESAYTFASLPPGEYALEENDGIGGVKQVALLVDPELRDLGVWGIVALKIDTSFYATPPSLSLRFNRRQEPLRYYVVTQNYSPIEFAALTVRDQGLNGAGGTELEFTRFDSPFPGGFLDDQLLRANTSSEGSVHVAAFQSNTEVARHERALRKLQLVRNSTVLIENLPLPGPERVKAEIVVHLSKP
jgi:hypothetical protein